VSFKVNNSITFETELEGFPQQYFSIFVDNLNEFYRTYQHPFRSDNFLKIGERVSKNFKSLYRPKTQDGYRWYRGLEVKTKEDDKLVVLFPCIKGKELDRSISIYGDKGISDDNVRNLLEKIICEVEKFVGPKTI